VERHLLVDRLRRSRDLVHELTDGNEGGGKAGALACLQAVTRRIEGDHKRYTYSWQEVVDSFKAVRWCGDAALNATLAQALTATDAVAAADSQTFNLTTPAATLDPNIPSPALKTARRLFDPLRYSVKLMVRETNQPTLVWRRGKHFWSLF
jgi:hypothetical protein